MSLSIKDYTILLFLLTALLLSCMSPSVVFAISRSNTVQTEKSKLHRSHNNLPPQKQLISQLSSSAGAGKGSSKVAYSRDNSNFQEKTEKKLLVKLKKTGGIIIETPKGDYSLGVAGYFQVDGTKFTGNTQGLNSGANIPSARLILSGNASSNWGYEFSYDFATTNIENAYISYEGIDNTSLVFGQFAPAWELLDAPGTTEDLTFLTTPLPTSAFTPPNGIGALLSTHSKFFVLSTDFFYPGFGATVTGDAPVAVSGTLSFSPVHTETKAWHFGLGDYYQRSDSAKTAAFTTPPETSAANITNLINTNTIGNVDYTDALVSSVATVQGPFSAQGEYVSVWVVRGAGLDTANFCGYYVTASYFLTGESRLYVFQDQGFRGITPIHNPNIGAWQVAARYSRLSLNSGVIQGGEEDNYTAGLNWYPVKRVRCMLNYIRVIARPNISGLNQTANVFSMRIQLKM